MTPPTDEPDRFQQDPEASRLRWVSPVDNDSESPQVRIARVLTLRFVLILGVLAVLALVSYLILDHMIARQSDMGGVIANVGQRRVLTQRVQLGARRILESQSREIRDVARRDIREAIVLLEQAHQSLVYPGSEGKGNRMSPGVHDLYFGPTAFIDRDLHGFINMALALAQTTDDNPEDTGRYGVEVETRGGELVMGLEALNRQYRRDNETRIAELRHLALGMLALTLTALLFSSLGVFLPMVRRIRNEIRDLERVRTKLRSVVDGALDAIITVDVTGKVTKFNPSAERIFGYRTGDVLGREVAELIIPPSLREKHRQSLNRVATTGFGSLIGQRIEMTAMRADGSEFPVEMTININRIGGEIFFTAFLRDITQRRLAEEEFRKLSQVVKQSSATIIITDHQGLVEYVNPRFTEVTGYTLAETVDKSPRILKSGYNSEETYRDLWKTIRSGVQWRGELYNRKKNGEYYWEYITISPIRSSDGTIINFIGMAEDLTVRKECEERLLRQTNYDQLTGLPNRLLALDRLTQVLARADRESRGGALALVDLDHFKTVNDTFGRTSGDQILMDATTRLLAAVRATDTVARLGTDEFLVILAESNTAIDAENTAHRILEAFQPPFLLGDQEIMVSVSVGLTLFPADGELPQFLMQNAEAAMYNAKEAGRNGYRFFTPHLNQQSNDRLAMRSRLARALKQDEFFLCYQPMVDPVSGRTVGAEALLRWRAPDLGLMMPDRFIPVAEDTGLITPIGEWVLDAACREAVTWQREGLGNLRIAVNISSRQVRDAGLVEVVARALDESGLPPDCLELEITESLLMEDRPGTAHTLERLRSLGVHLSLDDFGTGYSSLHYLKHFPFDVLKIDRSFVADLPSHRDDKALVTAIITMAHSLGLTVVGEGVENREQLVFLQTLNCDIIQGWLFSKALVSADFRAFVMKQRHTARSGTPEPTSPSS
ncbi:MAG: putative bifunctional diguanylate cyclase/phosphodiesterase [Alphaproteobacteria bacterium]